MKKKMPAEIQRRREIKDGYCIFKKTSPYIEFHYHDFYELEYVVSGSALVTVNGNEYRLGKGGAYLLRPTDMHEFKTVGESVIYSVSFTSEKASPKIMGDFMSLGGYLLTTLSDDDGKTFEALLKKTLTLYGKKYGNEVAAATLNVLISTLLAYGNSVKKFNEDESVLAAIRYINNNFTTNPRLEEIATIAGFTPTYFCRKFKAVTGKTFTEYLAQLKIDFASRLISQTDVLLTDICFASGFNSISQFIREFKKINGVSPSQYKKSLKSSD